MAVDKHAIGGWEGRFVSAPLSNSFGVRVHEMRPANLRVTVPIRAKHRPFVEREAGDHQLVVLAEDPAGQLHPVGRRAHLDEIPHVERGLSGRALISPVSIDAILP